MEYKVGDKVRIKSINEILKDYKKGFHTLDITQSKYCGEVHKVTGTGMLEGPVYTLDDVPGYWYESFLDKAENIYRVSVGWDMSVDLSITEYQYKKICSQSEKTGCTIAEVLRMLVAAGMQLLGEDESPC